MGKKYPSRTSCRTTRPRASNSTRRTWFFSAIPAAAPPAPPTISIQEAISQSYPYTVTFRSTRVGNPSFSITSSFVVSPGTMKESDFLSMHRSSPCSQPPHFG
ncbi:MAG: hypothetical protein IH576_01970 [Deltaproteobacteria bacterium]|nr:hypothetical protein [Deltaproteobacteria bacterium]